MNDEFLDRLNEVDDIKNEFGKVVLIKVNQLLEMENKIGRFHYQREVCWDLERKKLFIDSVMRGFPISNVTFTKKEGKIYCIDGHQRIMTIISFFKNEFDSLNGSYFRDFSKNLKEHYLNYLISIDLIESKKDLSEIYLRLNLHYPLIEKGVLYRDTYNAEINKLADHNFFKKHFPKRRQLEGYSIVEQLLTAITLIFYIESNPCAINHYNDLSLKNLNKFIEESIKENRIFNTNRINKTLNFLEISSYSLNSIEKRKIYNKVDLIPICLAIDRLSDKNIDPIRFSDKLREIYINLDNEYGVLRSKNTKSIENNNRRVEILLENFSSIIEKDY